MKHRHRHKHRHGDQTQNGQQHADITQYNHRCCVDVSIGHRHMSDIGTHLIRGVSMLR